MKQFKILRANELFYGSDMVRRFTFKTVETRDSYALLARANHNLAMDISILREGSALFQVMDCFECLSPHNISA